MRALKTGWLPLIVCLLVTRQAAAQTGFPPTPPNQGGISGFPMGISGTPSGITGFPMGALGLMGISGLPPTGATGIGGIPPTGIGGIPPTGVAGVSGMPTGISGISGLGATGIGGITGRPPTGFSGVSGITGALGGGPTGISGFSGGRFESVWTCGKCGREVARGQFSRPPANCPHCGVRLVNGFGPPSGSGTSPNLPINPGMPPLGPPTLPTDPGLPPVIPGNPLNPGLPPIDTGPNQSPPITTGPVNSGNGNEGQSFPATPDTGTNVYLNGMRSVVQVMVPKGPNQASMGSGSLVHLQEGYIITNWHVVDGATGNVSVLFPMWSNGRPVVEPERYWGNNANALQGRVIVAEQRCDLAIIKLLEPNRIPRGSAAVRFAANSPLPGAKVYSIGNPAASGSMWVYTPGEVRNVYQKRWAAGPDGRPTSQHAANIIEATSPTSPGDSGGPCFNDRCDQVGVTQGGLNAKVAQGFSYFIDGSEVKAFLTRNNVAFNVANEAQPNNNPGASSPPRKDPAQTQPNFPSQPNIPTQQPPTVQPSPPRSSPTQSASPSNKSDADKKESSDSGSSSSSGGGGKIAIIIVACLLGLGTIGAIVYGFTRESSAPKRKRRRSRNY